MIWKMNKVELYWLSSFICAALCKEVCGWEAPCLFMLDSPNCVRGLNDLFLGALISRAGLVCGCQGSLTFFRIRGTLEVSQDISKEDLVDLLKNERCLVNYPSI